MSLKNSLPIVIIFVLFILSCGQNDTNKSIKKEIKKVYGGHLRLSLSDNPVSIYPHEGVDVNSSDIIAQTYDGLVRYNANTLETIPAIAERWEISEDGKKYTFYLRKDAFFHDDPCFKDGKGKNIKASDVEYSMYKACTKVKRI
jgi:oligopeptide transport system substrate-binding protein